MIRVLIAEDEPAPARYLKSLIELHSDRLRVQAVAIDGREALRLAELDCPDVVFTDVRMPVLDGIGFVAELKARFPHVPAVIVSGHQEFDYARQALTLGVVDYLLKPVDPAALGRLLETLMASIDERRSAQRRERWGALLEGKAPNGKQEERFLLAVVRYGGPLSVRREWQAFRGTSESDVIDRFTGRDDHETVLLADADERRRDEFEAFVRARPPQEGYTTTTIAFADRTVAAAELSAVTRHLFESVDQNLTLGCLRVHWGPASLQAPIRLDAARIQELRLCLQDAAVHRLRDVIGRQLDQWLGSDLGTRQVLEGIRHLLFVIQRESPRAAATLDWESQLDAGAGASDSVPELKQLASELALKVSGLEMVNSVTQDAPEAFQAILRYLEGHFADPLSLDGVSIQFAVSQTYLSRLFRKHGGCTFHEYLTRLRLDAAERILHENPTFPLKVVAASVGYQDAFHFSRAFKAAKGVSPSEVRPRD